MPIVGSSNQVMIYGRVTGETARCRDATRSVAALTSKGSRARLRRAWPASALPAHGRDPRA